MQIIDALNAYRAGQLNQADDILSGLRKREAGNTDVWRLSAMVARGRGEETAALAHIQQALKLAPGHAEALNILGLIHVTSGDQAAAEKAYRDALKANPRFAGAAVNLANLFNTQQRYQNTHEVLRPFVGTQASEALRMAYATASAGLGRPDEAASIYDGLIQAQPSAPRPRHARAQLAIEAGDCEGALALLAPLAGSDLAAVHQAIFVANARLGRFEEARVAVERALTIEPASETSLRNLSQLLWTRGEADEIPRAFERSIAATGGALDVRMLYADILTQMERYEDARGAVEAARTQHGEAIAVLNAGMTIAVEQDDADTAHEIADRASALYETRPELWGNRTRAHLMSGEGDAALALIRRAREIEPQDQFWLGVEASALRLVDPEAYAALTDYERLAYPFDLEAPPGYASIAAFNEELEARLSELHTLTTHPLDQSLRLGSQTGLDLKRSDEPLFVAFFKALEEPIRAYMDRMGTDKGHPLSARNTGQYALSGAWSVKLAPGGRHVSHVHPEGWISSAYYVAVPDQVAGAGDYEGWIEFGRPPFTIPGGNEAEKRVEPRPGRLALFPSYMWHGTVPIRSGMRMTIAFDVVPE